jgi:beta-N-acetylhexosaminidase
MYTRLSRILSGLKWLCILTILLWAVHLKDPHLLVYRKYETILIFVSCVVGFVIFFRKNRGLWRITGLSILAAILIITLTKEVLYHYRKAIVLSHDLDIERKLSAHFIVGFDKIEELRPLVSKGIIGGIFITQRNAVQKTTEQLRKEISELQQLRKTAGLPKLIIATDQEGGIVSRLSPPLEWRPSLGTLAAKTCNEADLLVQAEAYGRQQGKELAHLGVTVNFSPVVDLQSDKVQNKLDFHSLINQRAISSSPEQTAHVALAYGRGLESQGVRPTLKHFPGLGGVGADTHHFSATLGTPIEQLASRDWVPFQEVAKQSKALIMLGHVILSRIDKENPVSFSHAVIQKIIRGTWKYDGLLITDDLTMAAAYNHGLCEATIKSLNAGVDLLLLSYDYEKYFEAMYCAVAAYKSGTLGKNQLERSSQRLEQLDTQ